MEVVLALLRTLVFVVATVAATVYVSRRIGRGRSLLWTGTTLLALYWLVLFGWTSYLTGTTNPSPELAIWVGWGGHLLPFFAALAYIWGIGQSAGFPSRAAASAGAALGKDAGRPTEPAPVGDATSKPSAATEAGGAKTAQEPSKAAPASADPAATVSDPPKVFPGPHAVPVVTTPTSQSPYGQGEPTQGVAHPGAAGESDRPSGQRGPATGASTPE